MREFSISLLGQYDDYKEDGHTLIYLRGNIKSILKVSPLLSLGCSTIPSVWLLWAAMEKTLILTCN